MNPKEQLLELLKKKQEEQNVKSPYGLLETFNKSIKQIQGEKGDKGDKGDRGDKGDKGDIGFSGKDGIDGINGTDGTNGKDGINGKDGVNGINGVNGLNGLDGSPDTADDIRNKLELLPKGQKLKIDAIEGQKTFNDSMAYRVNGVIQSLDNHRVLGIKSSGVQVGQANEINFVGATAANNSSQGVDITVSSTTIGGVSADGTTITGDGTPASPLGVKAGGVGVVTDGVTVGGSGAAASPLASLLAQVQLLTFTGAVNGTNLVFTLSSAPIASTLVMFDGSQFQVQGVDYNISGATVTFVAGHAPSQTLVPFGAVRPYTGTTDPSIISLQNQINAMNGTNVLTAAEQNMTAVGRWASDLGSPAFDIGVTAPGFMYLPFTSGNQAVKCANALTIGTTYTVSFQVKKISGAGCKLRVGTFSSTLSTYNFDTPVITSATPITVTGVITPASIANFDIGVLSANNNGSVFEITNVVVASNATINTIIAAYFAANFENDVIASPTISSLSATISAMNGTGYLTAAEQNMTAVGRWALQVGTPTFDVNSTSPGYMTVAFDSGINQSVRIPSILTVGTVYNVTITAQLVSGAGSNLRIGGYASNQSSGNFDIAPVLGADTAFSNTIRASSVDLAIGVTNLMNNGSTYKITGVQVSLAGTLTTIPTAIVNATAKQFDFLARAKEFLKNYTQAKVLTVVAFTGSSLTYHDDATANAYEGTNHQPPLMATSTFMRLMWEYVKTLSMQFTIPTYDQATSANGNWAFSGAWTRNGNRKPDYWTGQDSYWQYTNSNGAYAQFAVPNGNDSYCLITSSKTDSTNNFSILLSNPGINGGTPTAPSALRASYGVNLLDQWGNALPDTVSSAFGTTPYQYVNDNNAGYARFIHVIVNGLPAGVNTLRFTNQTTNYLEIWGGMYWNGKAIHFCRQGWGGRDMRQLYGHLYEDVYLSGASHVVVENCSLNSWAHGTQAMGTAGYTYADMYKQVKNYVQACRSLFVTPLLVGFQGFGIASTTATADQYANRHNTGTQEVYSVANANQLLTSVLYDLAVTNYNGQTVTCTHYPGGVQTTIPITGSSTYQVTTDASGGIVLSYSGGSGEPVFTLKQSVVNYVAQYPADPAGLARGTSFRDMAFATAGACGELGCAFLDMDGYLNDYSHINGNPSIYCATCDQSLGYSGAWTTPNGIVNQKDLSNGVFSRTYLTFDGQHLSANGHALVAAYLISQLFN